MYHVGEAKQTPEGHWMVPVARDSDGVIVAYATSLDQDQAKLRALGLSALAWDTTEADNARPKNDIGPGSRVVHAYRTAEHDNYTGVVVERNVSERASSETITYSVRWIKPNGDPSDGTTSHARFELNPA